MRSKGYTINQICLSLGIGNKSVIKYCKIDNSEKEKYDKKIIAKANQEIKRKQKEELIKKVKSLKEKGYNLTQISKELSLDRKTVKKYIESDGTLNHASVGNKFKSKLDKYKDEIITLYSNGYNSTKIFNIIKDKGYNGSDSLVRHFIANIKRNTENLQHINNEYENIERKNLIKLLYKDIEKIESITKEQLEKVLMLYPQLKQIYQLVKQFKEILSSKDIYKIDKWIKEVKELNIPELNSYISGIERDFEAVKNAIRYEYSNGLAEGIINKIKVIKRIMYGRCSFEFLRQKVLLLNFN